MLLILNIVLIMFWIHSIIGYCNGTYEPSRAMIFLMMCFLACQCVLSVLKELFKESK